MAIIATIAAIASTGCVGAQRGASPLDLTSRQRLAQDQDRRVRLIRQIMDEDLRRAQTLLQDFFAQPMTLYAWPLEVDLFKQTAMSCLHEPAQSSVGRLDEEQRLRVAQTLLQHGVEATLTCEPTSLLALLQTLPALGRGRAAQLLLQLVRVDELRLLRARHLQRAAQLPLLVRQQRLELERQRLELERQRLLLNRTQDDYLPRDYQASTRRIEELKRRHASWELSITALEERWPDWEPLLCQTLYTFAFELAGLDPQQPPRDAPLIQAPASVCPPPDQRPGRRSR